METRKNIIIMIILGIVSLSIVVCAANPQILTYRFGHWFNDRSEEQDTSRIEEYKILNSTPDNWTIEVLKPSLSYTNTKQTYNNGEKIQITSGTTITLTGKINTILASKTNPIIIEIN